MLPVRCIPSPLIRSVAPHLEQGLERLERPPPAEHQIAGQQPEDDASEAGERKGGGLRVSADTREEHHRLNALAEHGREGEHEHNPAGGTDERVRGRT
eukprot:1121427-Pyramimonas_sp.AAC.3